jgi:hypothetical protein
MQNKDTDFVNKMLGAEFQNTEIIEILSKWNISDPLSSDTKSLLQSIALKNLVKAKKGSSVAQ